jgi:putative transposase
MPRAPRNLLVVPEHPHHLILRGNNRRRLFSYPREYRFFSRRLAEGSGKFGVPVHACVLMTNHVHLLATPQDHQQLSRFVGFFAQSYAQFRNRSRGSTGKLFEQRYKSIPIATEEQLAVTTAYIELNPVRADMCVHPAEYRWSTFSQHGGLGGGEPLFAQFWSPSAWYLSLAADAGDRASIYQEWVSHYRARDDWSGVYPEPSRSSDRKRFERPDRTRAI